jgi:hypothetical protein
MIMRAPIPFVLGALLVLATNGCYYDKEELLYPSNFCDTTAVTWTNDIEPLINAKCATAGCHANGTVSPNLTGYSAVKAQADNGRLRARAINGVPSFMPASGKLPACDIAALDTWLDAGAPNN